MVSSVIRTTPVKQPNPIDYAESLLKRQSISRAERDKAVSLLDASMPLSLIEEARRKPVKLIAELQVLNAQAKKSTEAELFCQATLARLATFRDDFHKECEQISTRVNELSLQNGEVPSHRIATIQSIIKIMHTMLLESEPNVTVDDEHIRKIQGLLYQLSLSSNVARNLVDTNDNDADDSLDDFEQIEKIADERFQQIMDAERARLVCILTKYRLLCNMMETTVPLLNLLATDAQHHRSRAEAVNREIETAQKRHAEAQEILRINEELIQKLQSKTLT